MADIGASNWSETDASNTTAPPDGMPEGMNPSGVNDWGRAVMGAIKRWFDWRIPVTTAGTTAAYTVSYSVAPGALVDGMTHRVLFNAGNTLSAGDTTLNVNSLGAKPIKKFVLGTGWSSLAAGDLTTNSVFDLSYNAGSGTYRIVSQCSPIGAAFLGLANAFTGNNTFAGTSTFNGTVSASAAATFTGGLTANSGTNAFTGTIGGASTGTTQTDGDNSTKLATTAYSDLHVANGRVRAAVNWTGGGTSIVSQANVSSITRNGTGDYTVNFNAAIPSNCYAIPVGVDSSQSGPTLLNAAPGTTSVRIKSYNAAGSALDFAAYSVVVIG